MKKLLPLLLFVAAVSPVEAENWSIAVSSGPFVWGQFVERTSKVTTGDSTTTQTITLSASTRPGLSVDIERRFGDRFALRLEGAFARAPIAIKGTSRQDPTVSIPAGDIDVVTVMLPLIIRINPRGTFRFHVMAGPAAAAYTIRTRQNAPGTIPLFRGTRNELGAAIGAGGAWHLNDRWSIEGNITDINTSSPFREEEIGGLGSVEIPRPNNLHTTVGLRYRF